jgi:tetratricopeptide (TPR) repeat protein
VFSIVALVDGIKLGFGAPRGFVDDQLVAQISREVGAPVQVEHICAPPASILLADTIFHDYFMPRDPSEKYGPFSATIQKIKNASLILIDDEDAFRLREYCAYPRLSHRFNNDPEADLLGHRLQAYARNHHLLPREVVAGKDIPLEKITESINDLGSYLETPVMKLAFHKQFEAYTKGWDYTQYRHYISDVDYQTNLIEFDSLQAAIVKFVRKHKAKARFTTGPVRPFTLKDLPHFCSFLFRREAVDYIANQYESFCLAGLPSSLPYFEQRLKQLGKKCFHATTLNPERTDFDCLIATGFCGEVKTDKPWFDCVHTGSVGGRPHNATPEIDRDCPALAAGDPGLMQTFRERNGGEFPIGNYILNLETSLRAVFEATDHLKKGRDQMKKGQFADAAVEMNLCLTKRGLAATTLHGMEIFKVAPRHGLALCLVEMKDHTGARREFQKALLEEPKSRAVRFDYACFLVAENQPRAALAIFWALIEEKTSDVPVWITGGQVALSGPEFLDTALKWTEEGVRFHSLNSQIVWQRAEALTLAGKYNDALVFWRLLQNSSHPPILAGLVLCETLAGDTRFPVPLHLESDISEAFLKWRQRLKSFRARGALALLDSRMAVWQAILPTTMQSSAPALANA